MGDTLQEAAQLNHISIYLNLRDDFTGCIACYVVSTVCYIKVQNLNEDYQKMKDQLKRMRASLPSFDDIFRYTIKNGDMILKEVTGQDYSFFEGKPEGFADILLEALAVS
jgi:hypothetical protein